MDLESVEFREWLRQLTVFPISLEIARQSTQLDFSSDPADEIIAATSVVENMPLLTRDRRIRKSRLVPLATLGGVASHLCGIANFELEISKPKPKSSDSQSEIGNRQSAISNRQFFKTR